MTKISRVAIINNIQTNGVRGGAENFYNSLYETLKKYVPVVKMIDVPCCEDTFEDILKGYFDCYNLDLSAFDGVISSKAPTYAVSHRNHICYLMHTVRVFYDMYDLIKDDPTNQEKRKLIFRLDNELLSPPRTKKLFTIGNEVTNRLKKYNHIESVPLHPGITSAGFYCNKYEYIFAPGRLHPWKRTDLIIKSMKYVTAPVKLKIAGTGDFLPELLKLADTDERIEFLGYVDDDRLHQLYANALGVVFVPIHEDYGYILHEAFHSMKPVITCTDSGEPATFIHPGENGFLVEPDEKEIAKCIDKLYYNKTYARQLGEKGYTDISNITWENVAIKLLEALEE